MKDLDCEDVEYSNGYDQGYADCQSELSMKIKAILRVYLYSEKFMSPSDLATQIGVVLDG